MRRLSSISGFALLQLAFVVSSCGGGDQSTNQIQGKVANVVASLGLSVLTVGQTVQADAKAHDAAGADLTGQTITWTSDSPGIVSVTSAGVVTAVAPGTATITATVSGITAKIPVTVVKVPVALALTIQPSTAVVNGALLAAQPAVQFRDGSNQPILLPGRTINVAAGVGATVTGTTAAVTDANGTATFTDLKVSGTVGARTLVFTAAAVTGEPAVAAATSGAITLSAGAASQLTLIAQATAGTNGDPLPVQPVVVVTDASGNPVTQSGVPVTASIATGTGTLTGTTVVNTNASGVAPFTDLTVTGTGPITLKFTTTTAGLSSATSNAFAIVAEFIKVSFDAYATTAALIGDCVTWSCPDDVAPDDMVLDPAVAAPGHTKSMRYHYNHGTGDGCTTVVRTRQFYFAKQPELWSEYWIRWSADFTTANATCPPNDHKLIFGLTYAGINGRWAFYVGSDTPPLHNIEEEYPSSTQGGEYMNLDHAPNPMLYAESLWDGNWHKIRLHWKDSSGGGATDGMYDIWIDGVLYHHKTGLAITWANGTTVPDYIIGISLGRNMDKGPPNRDMYIWWGGVRVFTTNPGW